MEKKRLNRLQPDERLVRSIQRKAGCLPVTAAVLANRGLSEEKALQAFLHPSLRMIERGMEMAGMKSAVPRIAQAVLSREKILVFGDYDADGITATALLHEFLLQCGADASYYIPHRLEEGYGLKPEHIREVASERGIGLVITVDCGSGSCEAVETACRCGIDVIVTDHHTIEETPPAVAVINPQRGDCRARTDCLAGAGVAFILLVCLRKHLREQNFWTPGEEPNLKACCDLVALGTVADIVPMINENRILTKTGLSVINTSPRPGIRALIEVSGLKKPFLTAEDLAFRLAPRLNAAGRMAHAHQAVELLEASNMDDALRIAGSINECNVERQSVENRVHRRIIMHLSDKPELLSQNSLVLAGGDWHEGVLGIVASRLVQQYHKPVVLLAKNGAIAKGSARSIAGIDLYKAIAACSNRLLTFGGHPMAAGLSLSVENIEAFRKAFEQAVTGAAETTDLSPGIDIDASIDLAMISEQLADELERLAPFGPQNEEPLFAAKDIAVVKAFPIGQSHKRLFLRQGPGSGKTIEAIWFNAPETCRKDARFAELVFRLRWNYWNGGKRMQLVITDGYAC
jgi:single-stranded-DNA-specific exonuclease